MDSCKLETFLLALASVATWLPAATALPDLRILPLGDSITKGSGSSPNFTGYRAGLREKLLNQGKGITVDMIGTLRDGSMPDNDHEGHSGETLRDINRYWKDPVRALPNVVTLHAGTNNMDLEVDLDFAVSLMEEIVDGLFKNSPGVTILLAPVIWANKPAMQANTDWFNPEIEALIKKRQDQGKHILSVPIDITKSDLSDAKHPNNRGYEKMANAWLKAILEADSRGWLKQPTKVDASSLPGLGLGNPSAGGGGGIGNSGDRIWSKQGRIFDGFRTWEAVGEIAAGSKDTPRDKVHLADLNGDGIADYIVVYDGGSVKAWINGGKPNDWKSIGTINPDWSTITGDMIRFADVDGDGKADIIALYSDGAAKVWRNVDNGRKFQSLDAKWATGIAPRSKVHFEDVDGDGYADYVVVHSGGAVEYARNTRNNGKDSSKKKWETAKTIAPGPAGIPTDTTRLRDIDGDGKADYLIVYKGGAVKALRNTIGKGDRNWEDLGTIAPGVSGVTGDMIRFADMDGDGLADFLAIGSDGSIRMWKNQGIVGTKGSSLRLADLTGDGSDDIISVDSRGRARAWINKGVDKWQSIGEIAPGLDEDLSDSRIEFADVNGDKRADYLVIYGGGAVKAYLNNHNLPEKKEGVRIWTQDIVISNGVGEPGSKIRFADLNVDGYDDFLVLYDGGAVKCWLNNRNIPPRDMGRIWGEGQIVATGVGEPGSKIRFADLTGDGKADYIVQYDGGAARAYRNNGNIPEGSGRKWTDMGVVATGVTPQGPVVYADVDGDGKDDYLVVMEGGAINAYLNSRDWSHDSGSGGDGGGGGGDGDDEDDDDDDDRGGAPPFTPDNDEDPPPACPYKPKTMDEIEALEYNNELPPDCVQEYLVPVLFHMLQRVTERYSEIIDSDYDKYFNIFAKHTVSISPAMLRQFMMSNGSSYFECTVWSRFSCCQGCHNMGSGACDTCIKDCDETVLNPWLGHDSGHDWRKREMPCPPDMSQRGTNSKEDQKDESIWWSFTSDDTEEKFYDAVADSIGVPEDKIVFRDHVSTWRSSIDDGIRNCLPEKGGADPHDYDSYGEVCQRTFWWHDAPWVSRDFGVGDVFNPKDLIEEMLENVSIMTPLAEFSLAAAAGMYDGNANDLIDALVIPITMMDTALDHMEEVIELGKEIEEENLKDLITNILSSVLLFVGGGGGVLAGSLRSGFRFLGRSLVVATEAGHTALSLYGFVNDPSNPLLLLVGLVMSGVNIRDAVKLKEAAEIKRNVDMGLVSSISPRTASLATTASKSNRKSTSSSSICSKGRWA